jgi:hypothetical protein
LRREGRMIRLYLWFCRVLFCCTRTMGAVGTRPSLRPPVSSRAVLATTRARSAPRDGEPASAESRGNHKMTAGFDEN